MTRFAALTPVALGLAALAVGQPAVAPPPNEAGLHPAYLNADGLTRSCVLCHTAPAVGAKNIKSDEFVLLHEFSYWNQHDLHSRAFEALASPLGRAMSARLFIGDPAGVTTSAACLACHATDTRPKEARSAAPLAKNTAAGFSCQAGVNCQACHGPAGNNDWLAPHFQPTWRDKSPADKEAVGQRPLRDPAARAATCVGCHVGSAAEGKFVTHQMYAAGHPPLPPFELATFSRDEPRHWRPAAAVPHITGLPPEKARVLFSYRPGEVEAARLVAVGAVTALREAVRLAADGKPDPATGTLDFAHFNCAACHHELKVPSDRQANGFPGVAGRPVPTTWPAWAARAAVAHAGGPAGFEPAYAAWRQAFDAAPFGNKEAVAGAAAKLIEACEAALAAIGQQPYDPAAAEGLVRALTNEAGPSPTRRDYLDVDGAAQLARAVATIRGELATPPAFAAATPQPEPPPAFADGPLARLHERVGLTLREADGNRLLQDRGVYGVRAKRAFDFTAADFRAALAGFGRPAR